MAYRAMSLECSGNSEEAIVPSAEAKGGSIKLERLAGWLLQGSAGPPRVHNTRADE